MDPAIEIVLIGLLREHPIAVGTAVFGLVSAIGGTVWLVAKGYFNKTIANLKERLDIREERIKQLDEEVDRYKDRLQGASPDEAKERIDRLEAELAKIKPVRLSREDALQFERALGDEPGTIVFSLAVTNTAARYLFGDLVQASRNAGWRVFTSEAQGAHHYGETDVLLTVPEPQAMNTLQRRLYDALEGLGLVIRLMRANGREIDRSIWKQGNRTAEVCLIARGPLLLGLFD